jgi:hypothetical protein
VESFSTNRIAQIFKIDRAVATRAIAEQNVPPAPGSKPDRPLYSIADFAIGLEAYRRGNQSPNNDGAAAENGADAVGLTAARIRITIANAESKERDNLIAAGKLIPIESLTAGMNIPIQIMNEWALTLAGRITPKVIDYCPGARQNEIHGVIEKEVHAAMRDYNKTMADTAAELGADISA